MPVDSQIDACLNGAELEALLVGELSAADMSRLMRHVTGCAQCRARLQGAGFSDSQLRAQVVPDTLTCGTLLDQAADTGGTSALRRVPSLRPCAARAGGICSRRRKIPRSWAASADTACCACSAAAGWASSSRPRIPACRAASPSKCCVPATSTSGSESDSCKKRSSPPRSRASASSRYTRSARTVDACSSSWSCSKARRSKPG